MKQIFLFILLVTGFIAKSQTNETYATRKFTSIKPEQYLIALKTYKLQKFCADTVLLVVLKNDVAKEKTILKENLDNTLKKKYSDDGLKFKLASETNNGRVLVFGQYDSEDTPVRFFTFFINYENDKIVVLEIQNNE